MGKFVESMPDWSTTMAKGALIRSHVDSTSNVGRRRPSKFKQFIVTVALVMLAAIAVILW